MEDDTPLIRHGLRRATVPFAVPKISYSLFAHEILTAAHAYAPLHLPPAARGNAAPQGEGLKGGEAWEGVKKALRKFSAALRLSYWIFVAQIVPPETSSCQSHSSMAAGR